MGARWRQKYYLVSGKVDFTDIHGKHWQKMQCKAEHCDLFKMTWN